MDRNSIERSEALEKVVFEPKISKEQMKEMRIKLRPPVAIFPQTEYHLDREE